MLHLTCYMVPIGRKTPVLFIKGLHVCNSPMCTLSQNGYGDKHGFGFGRTDVVHVPLELTNDDVLKQYRPLSECFFGEGLGSKMCNIPLGK